MIVTKAYQCNVNTTHKRKYQMIVTKAYQCNVGTYS